MNTTVLTSAWEAICLNFFSVFTQPTAQNFIRLATGWILCTTRRTISAIFPFADPRGRRAHDAYHRFFPEARWQPSCLWQILAKLLIGIFYPTGTIPIDLDDTIFHRTGQKVRGAGYFRDAVRSTAKQVVYCWGLNLVVLSLRVKTPWGPELGLPINMRLYRKKRPASLIDLAEAMIRELAEWLPQRRFRASADGFYASLASRSLPRTELFSRIRCDAAIYDLPPKKKKGQRGPKPKKGARLPTPQQLARRIRSFKRFKTIERGKSRYRLVYTRLVIWYKVSHDPILLVISRDPQGKEKDKFLFSTDVAAKPAEVIGGFAGRWSIEETFKNTKQYLGAEQPQTWKGVGPERAAVIGLWLYSAVWLWYLQWGRKKNPLRLVAWYPGKSHPSFQDALAALRRVLWRGRINCMFGKHSVPSRIREFLIDALAPAA